MTHPVLEPIIGTLERTPAVLDAMLGGLPEVRVRENEGPGTWSPYDIVGHLILGERTDWIPRLEIVLSDRGDKRWEPFDMDGHLGGTISMQDRLAEFRTLRGDNLARLKERMLSDVDLDRTAIHPEYGTVTLRQHLTAWAAHDLNHIVQVSRVLAGRFRDDAGPWIRHLRILRN